MAVIGTPDDHWGETVTAIVETHDGARLDVDLLRAHCRDRLAAYKVPSRFEVVAALEMPRNINGKVQKHVLRESFATP